MSLAAATKSKKNGTDVPFSSLGDVRRKWREVGIYCRRIASCTKPGSTPASKKPVILGLWESGRRDPDTGGIMGTRPPEWLVVSSPAKRSTAARASCSSQQKTPPG